MAGVERATEAGEPGAAVEIGSVRVGCKAEVEIGGVPVGMAAEEPPEHADVPSINSPIAAVAGISVARPIRVFVISARRSSPADFRSDVTPQRP